MKITREQPQFTPITIVLETKDEADFIYGMLSIENAKEIEIYISRNGALKKNTLNKFIEVYQQ